MKPSNSKHQHYIIFKPHGYLSQFVNNEQRKNKRKLLGELFPFPNNLMAIGRLDIASEGLLLLTTDGKTSEYIRSTKIEKEYFAQVDGKITLEAVEILKNGIEITTETGKYITKNCVVKLLKETPILPERGKKIRDERHGPTSWISITLTEGKFRQVRKMTAAVGFPTLRLVRVRIGSIMINQMKAGQVIQVADLFNL